MMNKDMESSKGRMPWLYKRLHLLWLVMIAPIASVMVFLTPAFQVPDEFAHFIKTDQVSRGYLIPLLMEKSNVGNMTSSSVKKVFDIKGYHSIPFHADVKVDVITANNVRPSNIVWESGTVFMRNNNTAVYFPTGYAVQALGLLAARSMKANVISSFYFSRYLSCMACVLLSFLAIRTAGRGKLLLFILLSLPMTLFEYASLSQDGILISAAALGIALITGTDENPLGASRTFARHLLGLMMLALLVLGKTPYIFIFIYFLIHVYLKHRDHRTVVAAFGALVIGVIAAWTLMVAPCVKIPLYGQANPVLQVAYLKANPMVLVNVVLFNALKNIRTLIQEMIGVLGWLEIVLSRWSYSLMKILIYALLFVGFLGSLYRKRYDSLLMIAISILTMFMLSLSLYITWTPVGLGSVEGSQGRYMIPVYVFIAGALDDLWISNRKALSNLLVILIVCSSSIVCINALFAILQRYYM